MLSCFNEARASGAWKEQNAGTEWKKNAVEILFFFYVEGSVVGRTNQLWWGTKA